MGVSSGKTNMNMENPPFFMGKSTINDINMVIFNRYVKLTESTPIAGWFIGENPSING